MENTAGSVDCDGFQNTLSQFPVSNQQLDTYLDF